MNPEDHFFQLHQASLQTFFPGLNERSRYNQRKRDLWSVILAVRVSLQIVLDALQLEETAAIDSAPLPCVGYKRAKQASDFVVPADYGVCNSKAMKYFGCKFHNLSCGAGVMGEIPVAYRVCRAGCPQLHHACALCSASWS